MAASVGEELGPAEVEHPVEGLRRRRQHDREQLRALLPNAALFASSRSAPTVSISSLVRGVETIRTPVKAWFPSMWSPCQWLFARMPGVAAGKASRVLAQPLCELEAERGVEDERLVPEIDDSGVADGRQVVDDRRPDAVRTPRAELEIHASSASRSEPT